MRLPHQNLPDPANHGNAPSKMPLSPLQPHPQPENFVANTIERKLYNAAESSLPTTPTILWRTPIAPVPDIDAFPFLASPIPLTATDLNRDTRAGVALTIDASVSSGVNHTQPDALGRADAPKGLYSVPIHAPGEGPHDIPPIAFLRHTVSPTLSARQLEDELLPSPTITRNTSTPPPVFPEPKESTLEHRRTFAWHAFVPAPSATRHHPYTSNSLIRRPEASRPPHYRATAHRDRAPPAGQRELEAALETTDAPMGILLGPPPVEFGNITTFVEQLYTDAGAKSMDMDVEFVGWERARTQRQLEPRPNTAPTAAFTALLDEIFGSGSALRGEGPKPVERQRKAQGGGRGRGSPGVMSAGTGRSASSSGGSPDLATGMDIEESKSVEMESPSRARAWITEIHVLVKGKRKMTREVRSLQSQDSE
ncbi:hypothetical protein C8R43DRAFT_304120 [Mycena crocata]|nr:hypothetical protein C8R43DRAFT_304120 [Mycena crocata]